MDTNKIPLFGLLAKRLDWLSARQSVISENVANADTPGYVPQDLVEKDFSKVLSGMQAASSLSTTEAGHLAGTASQGNPHAKKVKGYETTPTGNSVVLEEQMSKLAETQIDYSTITNLYRKHLSMIRLALGART
jgi:flagellar basal-body rod protein FlgB